MLNKAFYYGVVGQKEYVVYSRVGQPVTIHETEDGGKVLVYKVPKSVMTGQSKNIKPGITPFINSKGKREYDIDMVQISDAMSNAQDYSKYSLNTTALKIYINKNGICSRLEQNLPKLQQEYFYDRLKKYIPEEQENTF